MILQRERVFSVSDVQFLLPSIKSEFMPLRALVAVIVTTVVMLVPVAWADTAGSYKARFMMPDGRIIDTANGNVSHTEGQGFAMLGGGE